MSLLQNGVGVILRNKEKAIVIDNMIIGKNICINIEGYNENYEYENQSDLNIVRIYKHLSEQWDNVNKGYIYGFLTNIEDSKLLYNRESYRLIIRDSTPTYRVGDADYTYSSLEEATNDYYHHQRRISNLFSKRVILKDDVVIMTTDTLTYKATLFCIERNNLIKEDVIFPIKIIMEQNV